MVNRRLLTPEFVDSTIPPESGELWIADTEVRGFGLRLWSTLGGGQKSFAIRVSNSSGKSVRKTYDTEGSWITHVAKRDGQRHPPDLGHHLEEARRWAKREIAQLKLSPEAIERKFRLQRRNASRVRNITLEFAAQRTIFGMQLNGTTERYTDRIDKLFSLHIPKKLRQQKLQMVSPKTVAKALISNSLTGYNAHILKAFVSRIFHKASHSYGPFLDFSEKLSTEFDLLWEKNRDVRYPELRKLTRDDFQRLFAFLENDNRWQQALAIRIYFKFKASLQRVLAAKWAHVVGDNWYPYAPKERVYWNSCEQRIDGEALDILKLILLNIERDFGKSCFLFPSPRNDRRSITNVQNVWRDALENMKLRYYPLREFSRSYREFWHPSYHRWFLDYYGPTFHEIDNTAELSKTLTCRINSVIDSSNYPTTLSLTKT